MSDRTGRAEAFLGLPGLRVLEVDDSADEVVVVVETTAERVTHTPLGEVAGKPGAPRPATLVPADTSSPWDCSQCSRRRSLPFRCSPRAGFSGLRFRW